MAKTKQADKVKFSRWFNSARDTRQNYDWQWFKYDLWVNGNHWAKWDKGTQTIVSVSKADGKPKVTINKIYAVLRGVRNYTLRNRPRAQVTPDNLTPENIDQCKDLNRFLDFLHDKLGIRPKLRSTLWHALKYSVGAWQILWNEEKQEIEVNVVDPYDLYWDPNARTPQEARYVYLAVRRSIADLKEDPLYKDANWEKIKADNKLASSTFKERSLKHQQGGSTYAPEQNKDDGTVILKECWYLKKVKDTEKDENGKEVENEKDQVWICAYVGDEEVRKPEQTDYSRIPFFVLPSDIEPLSLYGQGWVKNLIPLNKTLNELESSVAEYNHIINKGKWISDRTAGVRIIDSEHGQIIEKKRGTEVTAAPVPLINAVAVNTQIEHINNYFEDIGAMHDATRGRVPVGAKSGVAIEMLQIGDSNNLAELVENTEEFLEDAFEFMLELASQKYQFARNISPINPSTGERDFVSFIGEGASNQVEGATVIPQKNTVDVKIGSWLADTQEARRDTLKDLYAMQVIDQETLLKGYEIGNVADIIDKTKMQKESDMVDQAAMAQVTNPQPASPQQGSREAIAFIRQIITSGTIPQLPEQVSQAFVDYLGDFLSKQGSSLPDDIVKILSQARDEAQRRVVN